MVKKLKQMAETQNDSNLSEAIRESAQQIWLAGLGAFAKAQEEGGKVFEALVKEGTGIQKRTRKATEDTVGEVTGKMTQMAGSFTNRASQSWDKLEQIFEDRVARALKGIGVPTYDDVVTLTARVEELTRRVEALTGAPAARKGKAKMAETPVVTKTRTARPAADKADKAVKADKPTAKATATKTAAAKTGKAPATKAARKPAARKATVKSVAEKVEAVVKQATDAATQAVN